MNHKITNQASILFNLIKNQNKKTKHLPLGSVQSYVHMHMYKPIYESIALYICRVAGAFREESYVLSALGISRYVVGHVCM